MFPYFNQSFFQTGPMQHRKPTYTDGLMAFSSLSMGREDLEVGNKVLLPASALQQLMNHRSSGPMIFKLTNTANSKVTYVGVLEFIAEEGTVIVPHWIFENNGMYEGVQVTIQLVDTLPKGKVIRLQPHETAFIDLSDPRAILENSLRTHVCLTEGETINIQFAGKQYQIDIVKVEPVTEHKAVNVNEADVEIDFLQPLVGKQFKQNIQQDYEEQAPNLVKKSSSTLKTEDQNVQILNGQVFFSGKGVRLDGKAQKKQSEDIKQQQEGYNPRKHKLNHGVRGVDIEEQKFQGQGQKLGASKQQLKR